MVTNWSFGDVDHLIRQERRLVTVRWAASALILAAAVVYRQADEPLTTLWWTPVAFLVACNLYLQGSLDSVKRTHARVVRMLVIVTAFDWVALGVLASTWVYDDFFGGWPTLMMLPLLGGLRFTLVGSVSGWLVGVGVYTVTSSVVDRLDRSLVLAWETLLFRWGLLLVMALAIGFAVREQVASRRDAENALEHVRRSEAWRARLVATLGHDVRAPMAHVVSAAQMLQLRGHVMESDLVEKTYEAIDRQASRALRLADDLLDMARMEHGTFTVDRTTVDLVSLAQRVVGGDRDVAIDAEQDPLPALVDAARLEQVMHNLVANARRHGKPPITIELRRRDGHVEIAVADHGPGLPEEARDQMFEAFTHGGAAASTGLGLWIVTTIVHAHGGTVDYRDVPTGGACFLVRLPQRDQIAPPEGSDKA